MRHAGLHAVPVLLRQFRVADQPAGVVNVLTSTNEKGRIVFRFRRSISLTLLDRILPAWCRPRYDLLALLIDSTRPTVALWHPRDGAEGSRS